MQTIDYEKAIIGKLLIMNSRNEQLDVLCELEGVPFFAYSKYLKAISKLVISGHNADILKLHEAGFDAIELSELTSIVSSADIGQYISGIKVIHYKDSLVKKIESHLREIKGADFYNDMEEVKVSLLADLNGLSLEDKSDFISIKEYKEQIKQQLENKTKIEGYSWGISDIDKFTSGISKSRLYVIGGLKKSGKSRFVIHTLKQLHNQKIKSCYLSLEMGGYENTKLLHSAFTGINDLKFRSGSFLSREELQDFKNTVIDENFLSIETKAGLTLNQVLQRIRRYSKLGYEVCFIDYLQRILRNKGEKDSTAEHYEKCSVQIADTARQNKIAVVLLSQLNAEAEREAPNMGNLKGSGGIGEAADTILLMDNLFRRTKRESEKNKFDVYIEQRYGDSGKITIWADLSCCKFGNLAKDSQSYFPDIKSNSHVTNYYEPEQETN